MAFDGTLKFDTAIDKKGFQTGLSKLGGLAKTGLSLVGRSITAASTSLSGLGGYAVNVGKNFESSMSKVAAVSGATGDEFDALRNKASELGENTIFSASEAADALNYMAMAGWKTEEMLDGVGGVLDLAASSGADLATTSDIVTDALTAFGEPASSAGRLADAPELIGAAAVLLVAIGEAFTNFLNAIKDTLNKWIGELLSTIGDFFSDQYECAVESAEEMIGYIADFWSSVGQSIGNALAALGKTIKDAYDAAVDGTEQLIEDTVNFFKSLPTKISESLSNALAKISKWGTDAYNSAVNSAKNTINGIVDYFTGLPAKIAAKLLEALNKVTTWGSDLVQKGRTAASDLVTAIVEGIKSLPDKLKDIGKQLVSGLWDGIKDSTDWLGEKVENFGGNLVGKVKGVFGIHSPSKVMRDSVGVHLAQGIGEGFTEELPEVGRDALAAFKQLEIAEPRIRYDSGAVEALRLQGNLGTPNIAPSATSETINNHYSYSTVNNNAPKTPENTPINVSLYVDGKLAAEGSAELNDREQGERIKLRKRGLAD